MKQRYLKICSLIFGLADLAIYIFLFANPPLDIKADDISFIFAFGFIINAIVFITVGWPQKSIFTNQLNEWFRYWTILILYALVNIAFSGGLLYLILNPYRP